MRPVQINFGNADAPPRVLCMVNLLLASFAFVLLALAWGEQRALDRLRAELSDAVAQRAVITPATAAPRPLYEQSARRMLAERSADWPGALRALEQVRVEPVQVVAFEVSAVQMRVRLDVRFADMGNLLAYVRALERAEPQARWEIEQASQGRAGEPARAIVFRRLAALQTPSPMAGRHVVRPDIVQREHVGAR